MDVRTAKEQLTLAHRGRNLRASRDSTLADDQEGTRRVGTNIETGASEITVLCGAGSEGNIDRAPPVGTGVHRGFVVEEAGIRPGIYVRDVHLIAPSRVSVPRAVCCDKRLTVILWPRRTAKDHSQRSHMTRNHEDGRHDKGGVSTPRV